MEREAYTIVLPHRVDYTRSCVREDSADGEFLLALIGGGRHMILLI